MTFQTSAEWAPNAPSVPVPACVTTDLNSNSGLAVALAWLVSAWVSGCVVAVGG